jgi:hypothetical protein
VFHFLITKSGDLKFLNSEIFKSKILPLWGFFFVFIFFLGLFLVQNLENEVDKDALAGTPGVFTVSPNSDRIEGGKEVTISGSLFENNITGERYQRVVTINSSSALSNKAVMVTLDTKTLIENDKMKEDCGGY